MWKSISQKISRAQLQLFAVWYKSCLEELYIFIGLENEKCTIKVILHTVTGWAFVQ